MLKIFNKNLWPVLALQTLMLIQTCPALDKSEKNCVKNDDFKIITYNVLCGFNHHKSEKIGAEWINKQNPDVVALQELNGFTEKTLKQIAAKWGHNYAVILKENGFPVGLTSKTPIEVIERRLKGMHHGWLHCKTSGIDFFVIHLSPFKYKHRQKEAKSICQKVKPLLDNKESVVVLGDFNSVCSSGKEFLNEDKVFFKYLIEKEKKNKHIRNLNNGHFDFTVMDSFLNIGLKDACCDLIKNTPKICTASPALINGKIKKQQIRYSKRIDFILLNNELAQQCINASISYEDKHHQISDHFPVIITLNRDEKNTEQKIHLRNNKR